jgi:hypothetical protein
VIISDWLVINDVIGSDWLIINPPEAMESGDPDLRSSNMWPAFALFDNSFASRTVARLVVSMFWPLATRTEGPLLVGATLMQWGSAAASR